MAKYAGNRLGITPTAGVANWVLETQANKSARVSDIWWGGEVTTSQAMRTRVALDSAIGTGSRTAGDVQKLNPKSDATVAFFSTTYATTQPTISAGALFGISWNAHGGAIRYLTDPGGEFLMADSMSIECRQDVGAFGSSYGVKWEDNF